MTAISANAGDLLTAVPGLLGFIPERSLILVPSADATILSTMRQDIHRGPHGEIVGDFFEVIDSIGPIIVGAGADRVDAIIVDDRPACAATHLSVMQAVNTATRGRLTAGYHLARMAEGEPWTLVWGDDAESDPVRALGDPFTSPIAVHFAVTNGRHVAATRNQIMDLTPTPCHCRACFTAQHFDGANHFEPSPADALAAIMDALAGDPASLDCRAVHALGAHICDLNVRDAALVLGATDLRFRAEQLWRTIARRSVGTPRASAATMLAHQAYIAGEGAAAGLALDTALTADNEWGLAQVLDAALREGVHPNKLWETLPCNLAAATALGVTMPDLTLRPAA